MLTLKNIKNLRHKHIGEWEIVGIEECDKNEHHIGAEHYNIRLSRNDIGAAIQIERNIHYSGYRVCVCYEQYDKFISITEKPKDKLLDKHSFFATMQGILDAQYDKTH